MRIMVFAEYLPPRLGSDRRIFEIMKRLANKHEIHFVVFPPFRELRDEPARNGKGMPDPSGSQDDDVTRLEGINKHAISISYRVALLWRRSLSLAFLFTAMSVFLKSMTIMKRVNPDLVVLNYPSPYTGLLGFLEGRLWKKPVTVDFNDLIAQYSSALLKLRRNGITARLLIMIQNYIARRSDKIVTPTNFIRSYITSLGVLESRVEVISNGVDTKNFNLKRSDDDKLKGSLGLSSQKLCVYCGRLDGWAGIDIVLKVCDMARSKKLNVKFLLVGSGEGANIEKENVILIGEVPHARVPSVLSIADVILVPFPNNEVSHAASPLKLFEGMAMQKPVIASRVSGIKEIITDGQNGFLADPDDVDEWVNKLKAVLGSEALAAWVGENAKRTVEDRFDWAILAERYEEILNAVALK